jgi:hypothetical protein
VKDQEVEGKLERMQWDYSDDSSSFCVNLQSIADEGQEKFRQENRSYNHGQGPSLTEIMSAGDEGIKATQAAMACREAASGRMVMEGGRLWKELRATAGLPLN